jgi:hypothetical protein
MKERCRCTLLLFFNQQETLPVSGLFTANFQDHPVCIRGMIGCDKIGEERHEKRKNNDDHTKNSSPVFFQPLPDIRLYGYVFFQNIISLSFLSNYIFQNYQNYRRSPYRECGMADRMENTSSVIVAERRLRRWKQKNIPKWF